MGKRFSGKAVNRNAVQKRVKDVKRSQPFGESSKVPRPITMRDRQRSWMLAGLKHLKAPVASWPQDNIKPDHSNSFRKG